MKAVHFIGYPKTINSQAITVLQEDADSNVLFATGTVTVTDAGSGYAKGCLYIDTDVAAGTGGLYQNVGSTTSCNFDKVDVGTAGATAFTGLTDVPANYTAAANKIVKVNTGATALEFVDVSGDADMSAAGVFTVTDLTIAGEAQGAILYRGATTWDALSAGTTGYILKAQGAAANPVWVDPATLPMGVASSVTQSWGIEGGTNDIVVTTTTQTVGAGALTIPDFAGVADEFVFKTKAVTLANKTLTLPKIVTTGYIADGGGDEFLAFVESATPINYVEVQNADAAGSPVVRATGDDANVSLRLYGKGAGNVTFCDSVTPTKMVAVSAVGATATKIATLTFLHTNDVAITFPDATDTLVGKATTDTLTNKTLSDTTTVIGAAGALTKAVKFSNTGATADKIATLTFVHTDNRAITFPDATDTLVGKATADVFTNKTLDCDGAGNVITNVNANELDSITGNTYGVPFVVSYLLTNQAAAVNIFNANAPFKFKVIGAYSLSTSADGGTWKLNNGALGAGTDICSAITVAASDGDKDDMVAGIASVANRTIAQNGSLSIVPDAGGTLDCEIFVTCLRVD